MMPEPTDRLDDRIRAALRSLDDDARRQVRPPGADLVPAAGRWRRVTRYAAAGVALAVVLAVGSAAGRRIVDSGQSNVAGGGCVPTEGAVFLPLDATPEQRQRVGDSLTATSAVWSVRYQTREEAWERFQQQFRDAPDLVAVTKPEALQESWQFEVCTTDYPAVKAKFKAQPGLELWCACERNTTPNPKPTD
jgi:cell division transport system permease protein